MPTARMSCSVVLVMVATVARLGAGETSDYCSFTPKHTMCRPGGVSAECSQYSDRQDPHFTELWLNIRGK